jgi:transcriptional regulator with XRE-family HTH domain
MREWGAEVLGEALALLRGRRTQRQVAAGAGIDPKNLSLYELGRRVPRERTLAAIRRGLGCSRQELAALLWRLRARRLLEEGRDLLGSGRLTPAEGTELGALLRRAELSAPLPAAPRELAGQPLRPATAPASAQPAPLPAGLREESLPPELQVLLQHHHVFLAGVLSMLATLWNAQPSRSSAPPATDLRPPQR